MVVLVEVARKGYLAAVVPVIVNAILSEHQLVVDIVAFVSKGDFPRSRLGEKQRGRILATWVTRKMRTIAQFGIRDPDGADSQITEVAEPTSRMGSQYNGSTVASSLRHAEAADDQPSPDYPEEQVPPPDISEQQQQRQQFFAPLPTGISEMPAEFDESPDVSRADDGTMFPNRGDDPRDDNDTPTDAARPYHFELPGIAPYDGSTPPPINYPSKRADMEANFYEAGPYHYPSGAELSSPSPPPPAVPPKVPEDDLTPRPMTNLQGTLGGPPRSSSHRQSTYLPSVSGHETLDMAEQNDFDDQPSGSLSQPSTAHRREPSGGNMGGGLRIANTDPSSDEDEEPDRAELSDWPQEAIMHMNLASSDGRPVSKKDSRGAKLGMHVYGKPLAEPPPPPPPGRAQQPSGPVPPPKDGGGSTAGGARGDSQGSDLYEGYGYGHAM